MRMVIGVSGGSGSGKTTLARELAGVIGASVIHQDDYYLPYEMQPVDDNGCRNFDTPGSIDRPLMWSHVNDLARGERVIKSVYTFGASPSKETRVVEPSDIVIVEGLFVFEFREIWDILSLSVYVDEPEDIRFERRLRRDTAERACDPAQVRYQWLNHVIPCERAYLEPHRERCNLVVGSDEARHVADRISLIKSGKT